MEFNFQRHRIDKIASTELMAELLRVANARDLVEFGKREFSEFATVSSASVIREFGSWSKAIDWLRSELAQQGKVLQKKHRGYFTKAEAFAELERVWRALGHRPSKIEWENSKPAISYQTYIRYFGGWSNACLSFLESRSAEVRSEPVNIAKPQTISKTQPKEQKQVTSSRNVPAGLRLCVYERDRFRCVFCGRSPISDLGAELHVDHIQPFSQGGETKLENLQTLCSLCNLGKGDRTDVVLPKNG